MNNQNLSKFLPLGSVVLLKNGKKRVMINGFCAISDEEKNSIYDYSGVLFPEGLLNSEQTLLFNHNQIIKVYHLGLIDEEQKNFSNKLINIVNQMKNN